MPFFFSEYLLDSEHFCDFFIIFLLPHVTTLLLFRVSPSEYSAPRSVARSAGSYVTSYIGWLQSRGVYATIESMDREPSIVL